MWLIRHTFVWWTVVLLVSNSFDFSLRTKRWKRQRNHKSKFASDDTSVSSIWFLHVISRSGSVAYYQFLDQINIQGMICLHICILFTLKGILSSVVMMRTEINLRTFLVKIQVVWLFCFSIDVHAAVLHYNIYHKYRYLKRFIFVHVNVQIQTVRWRRPTQEQNFLDQAVSLMGRPLTQIFHWQKF